MSRASVLVHRCLVESHNSLDHRCETKKLFIGDIRVRPIVNLGVLNTHFPPPFSFGASKKGFKAGSEADFKALCVKTSRICVVIEKFHLKVMIP